VTTGLLLIVCSVIFARGCRAENPDLFARPDTGFEIPRARRHARGNDNRDRDGAEAVSLYCARLNSHPLADLAFMPR